MHWLEAAYASRNGLAKRNAKNGKYVYYRAVNGSSSRFDIINKCCEPCFAEECEGFVDWIPDNPPEDE